MDVKKWLQETRWFGLNAGLVIFIACAVVVATLFLPLFSVSKVIEVKETVVVTETKQVPETVTEEVPTKVYVGYLEERGQTSYYGGYYPVIIYSSGGSSGGPYNFAQSTTGQSYIDYYPYYTPYYTPGRKYQIDASDGYVELQQAKESGGTLTVTLTDINGKQQVFRNIAKYDLTKTGEIKVPTTVTRMKTVTEQVPREVTKEQVVTLRVNLIQLLTHNY